MGIIPVVSEIIDMTPKSFKFIIFIGIIAGDTGISMGLFGFENGLFGTLLTTMLNNPLMNLNLEITSLQLLIIAIALPLFYFMLRKSS